MSRELPLSDVASGLRDVFHVVQKLSLVEHALSQDREHVRLELADVLADCISRSLTLLDELLGRSEGGVGDLAFAARLELSQSLQRLQQEQSAPALIVSCETARRKLCRGLFAVIGAMAGVLGVPHVGLAPNRENAVEVRKLYAKFRMSLRRHDEVTSEVVGECLQYAAASLASVFAAPAFTEVRIEDARLLRHIRDRILQWAQAGRDPKKGVALFRDIKASAEILRGINRRQELQQNDAQRLQDLISYLKSTGAPSRLDTVSRLSSLSGRCDAMDDLAVEVAERGLSSVHVEALKHLAAVAYRHLPSSVDTGTVGGVSPENGLHLPHVEFQAPHESSE